MKIFERVCTIPFFTASAFFLLCAHNAWNARANVPPGFMMNQSIEATLARGTLYVALTTFH